MHPDDALVGISSFGVRVVGGRLISDVDVITTSPLVEVQIDILITIIGELLDTVLPTAACCSGYL